MSAESAPVADAIHTQRFDVRTLRVLRYAVGSSIAMAVALGFDWQLSFLTPVLALSFLASPAPRPSLQQGGVFVLTIAVACLVGLWLSRFLLPYPLVYLPLTFLLLFRLFLAKAGGKAPMLITWLLIALLVIPMLAMQSPDLADLVAAGIVVGACVTIALVWIVDLVLPLPIENPAAASAPSAAPSAPAPGRGELYATAMMTTLVVFPVLTLFYTLQWSGAMLVLVFVALLSSQPGFAKSYKAGAGLVLGNSIGGAAAILFYELLVLVPEFVFLVLLTLLTGMLFGARLFSGKPTAPLYGMAYSTVLLVIGSTTSSSGDAGAKVYTRILQILCAVVYVVTAFGTIERFRREREA
ncbi:MAG: DUF2955 domain-containing protein [Candidatus Latescibacterota bacterium]|nr:MAG: DUF2955 domain-containing protein [Candidatus Latescibacterota bacterium]